jgi:predicted regulator of Ras-like GTPase activity (Roadblock/LC7/MglB family)
MNASKADSNPLQKELEQLMSEFAAEDRWEAVMLFSSDGLLMAGHGESPILDSERLLEFAFSQIETVQMIGDDLPVKEVVIRARSGRLLAFRYFDALGEQLVLAAVAYQRRGFRNAMNSIIRYLQKLT